jgi:hypothetical protein
MAEVQRTILRKSATSNIHPPKSTCRIDRHLAPIEALISFVETEDKVYAKRDCLQ